MYRRQARVRGDTLNGFGTEGRPQEAGRQDADAQRGNLPDDYKVGATDNSLVSFGATLGSTSTKRRPPRAQLAT